MTTGRWHLMDRALRHWLCCLPILLCVAFLSARQIDALPPTVDEFYSLANAGWLADGANSPIEILRSLARNSPNHAPLYFLLLGFWGDLTTAEIALARILSILFALLALAMIYRLGSDFIGGPGGLFALIIAAGNAYFNFHIAFARMYTLLLLLSALALWLYLRLMLAGRGGKWRDLLALGAAVYLLANTFLFSAMFLLMLGIAHLLLPRERRWIRVALTVCAALLLFSPWLAVVIPAGFGRFGAVKTEYLDGFGALYAWLMVYSNGALWLPLLGIGGLILGWRRGLMQLPRIILLFSPIFLLLLFIAASVFDFAAVDTMRYHLAGWLPYVILLTAGLVALYRLHAALGALTLLWLAAALTFPQQDAWTNYISGRARQFTREPMHLVSREALRAPIQPLVVSYKSDHFIFDWSSNINYSQREHYFTRPGLALETVDDIAQFTQTVRFHAITTPSIWLVYQDANLAAPEPRQLLEVMRGLHYRLCDSAAPAPHTQLLKWSWTPLDCETPTPQLEARNAFVEYTFYGAALDESGDAIVFNDRWHAKSAESLADFAMSWKLMKPDWTSRAQLDLPLVNESDMRQFTLDVAAATAGEYELTLVLYDRRDGATIAWEDNASAQPAFLPLAAITIE